jgi:hypothetical protein
LRIDVQAGTVRDARVENRGSHKPAPEKRAPIVGPGLEGVFIQEPAGHQRIVNDDGRVSIGRTSCPSLDQGSVAAPFSKGSGGRRLAGR